MIPIQFLTFSTDHLTHEDTANIALEGGCKWIEVHTDIQDEAQRIVEICHKHEATCIIYNNVELCKEIKADGVRLALGRTDLMETREALGHEFIIGATAFAFDDIKKCKRNGADYICCGTYGGHAEAGNIDLAYYAELMKQLYTQELRIPICAYGHIAQTDIMPLIESGVQGICASQESFVNGFSADAISQMLNADE